MPPNFQSHSDVRKAPCQVSVRCEFGRQSNVGHRDQFVQVTCMHDVSQKHTQVFVKSMLEQAQGRCACIIVAFVGRKQMLACSEST